MPLEMSVSQIELALSPALYDMRTLKGPHTVVAVDILRATTSICAAFQSGATEVVPLASLDELEPYRALGYLRAAERGGRKVGDAECGNSPTEYLTMNLHGRRIAYSTTNGTSCILRGTDAEETLVGSFANLSRLTGYLTATPRDIVIICSGWQQDFSLEDTLFAGALCHRLTTSGRYAVAQDAAVAAMELWTLCHDDPYAYCATRASHIRRLEGFGATADINFSFRIDTCPVLPRLFDRKVLRVID